MVISALFQPTSVTPKKKSWMSVISKSVSFLSQNDVVMSVPLADEETDEEDIQSNDDFINTLLVPTPCSV